MRRHSPGLRRGPAVTAPGVAPTMRRPLTSADADIAGHAHGEPGSVAELAKGGRSIGAWTSCARTRPALTPRTPERLGSRSARRARATMAGTGLAATTRIGKSSAMRQSAPAGGAVGLGVEGWQRPRRPEKSRAARPLAGPASATPADRVAVPGPHAAPATPARGEQRLRTARLSWRARPSQASSAGPQAWDGPRAGAGNPRHLGTHSQRASAGAVAMPARQRGRAGQPQVGRRAEARVVRAIAGWPRSTPRPRRIWVIPAGHERSPTHVDQALVAPARSRAAATSEDGERSAARASTLLVVADEGRRRRTWRSLSSFFLPARFSPSLNVRTGVPTQAEAHGKRFR